MGVHAVKQIFEFVGSVVAAVAVSGGLVAVPTVVGQREHLVEHLEYGGKEQLDVRCYSVGSADEVLLVLRPVAAVESDCHYC